jgi:Ca2+-binding RTX toxin-like protein
VCGVLLWIVLPAAPAAAAQCSFEAGTHTVSITNEDPDGVKLENAGGDLEVNDVVCATIADVDTVQVDMAGIGLLDIRLDGGPMGPGFTDEGDGSSELEFDVVGVDDDSWVRVFGSSVADGMSTGERLTMDGLIREINANALEDGGDEDVDVTVHGEPGEVAFSGEDGDDELIGTGTGTTGSGPLSSGMSIVDGPGADLLWGGDGPDTIIVDLQDDGADAASGGPGHDIAGVFALAGQDNDVSLDDQNDDGTSCPLGLCDDDNIASDFEEVVGFSANDRIVAGAGNHILSGGGGDDQLFGGPGDDGLFGDADDDLLTGGGGNDVLWDAAGADVFLGGAGLDTADFSRRFFGVHVTVDGLANDGSSGEGDNVDTDVERLVGTDQSDWFEGGPGPQVLIGAGDDDIIEGGDGADVLRGGVGEDRLFGASGPDRMVGGPDRDWLLGGTGIDMVSYQPSPSPVRVVIDDVANDGAIGEHDRVYANVERVLGSPFDDRLIGNGSPNVLFGGSGDDVLRGLGGNDSLYGGSGGDAFDGGSGTDLCAQGGGTGTKVSCER